MMTGTLTIAADAMHGTLKGPDGAFRGVSTDTRSLNAGELFVALKGPNFDGTAFVARAAEKRAAGAVVPRAVDAGLPLIVVDDTLKALGELAASWRRQVPATVVGITGSNGKTTLKELVASCLAQSASTLATSGNLNNEIGLPLMLLRLDPAHEFAVIEMGANHAGEIAYLTSLAAPRVVAITNAGPAHLEGFGSLDGVARAKGEILCGDEAPEVAVLNADDGYFGYWKSLTRNARLLTFGLGGAADVRASDLQADDTGMRFTLHMPGAEFAVGLALQGRHNVVNACAAAAIAVALDIPAARIRRGLEAVRPVHGRLEPLRSRSGATLYDDSYNANPVSVRAAAEFLAARGGDSWIVLGDMAELGGDAGSLHAQTGRVIREAGIRRLLATGPLSRHTVEGFGEGGRWFESTAELAATLNDEIGEGDNVLVKGSRSTGMESVVEALVDPAAGDH